MFKGFRDFIFRGNVVDLAVAVIIGAAFNAIISSLVADVLNPLIAATVGKPDFSSVILHVGGGEIKVGNFFNAAISFLIVAACRISLHRSAHERCASTNEETRSRSHYQELPGMSERDSVGSAPLRALCSARRLTAAR